MTLRGKKEQPITSKYRSSLTQFLRNNISSDRYNSFVSVVISGPLYFMINTCHYYFIQDLRVNFGTEEITAKIADSVDSLLQMQGKRLR